MVLFSVASVVQANIECICQPGYYPQDLGCWALPCNDCVVACLANGVGMQSCNACQGSSSPGILSLVNATATYFLKGKM